MIFDSWERLGGYVWCSVVRDLIVEKWQTTFSDPSTLRHHNYFGILYKILEKPVKEERRSTKVR
jgi:hypothetical protein